MSEYHVDLTNCDKEPIHIPGKVQAHGFLIAVNSKTHTINYISQNFKGFTGKEAAYFLDKPVDELEQYLNVSGEKEQLTNLLNLARHNKTFDTINPYQVILNQNNYNVILATSNDELILEFEPADFDLDFDVQKTIGRSVSEILSGKSLKVLLENAASELKKNYRL